MTIIFILRQWNVTLRHFTFKQMTFIFTLRYLTRLTWQKQLYSCKMTVTFYSVMLAIIFFPIFHSFMDFLWLLWSFFHHRYMLSILKTEQIRIIQRFSLFHHKITRHYPLVKKRKYSSILYHLFEYYKYTPETRFQNDIIFASVSHPSRECATWRLYNTGRESHRY